VATEVMDVIGVVGAVDVVGAEGEVEAKERNITAFSFLFFFSLCFAEEMDMKDTPGRDGCE